MAKPMLSIGMIFKNEIRCLERCMKSLQPLRDTIPCELVMADTGAEDGSREIAERYADILIDFPWMNDFAAARNAVMEHCSGEWFLTVDADEWLDKDFSQLVQFLHSSEEKKYSFCGVIQRNYATEDFEGNYGDFLAIRMARLSAGVRYSGAIHESWTMAGNHTAYAMNRTVLHHDGYVGLNGEAGKEKRKRNMTLLRKELEKNPDDLKTMLQCIESSGGDSDHEDFIRRAVEGVKKKLPHWERLGPAIFRSAVAWSAAQAPEEFERNVEDARTWFPDSLCTNVDVEYMAFNSYLKKEDYEKAVSSGEIYLQALQRYQTGQCDVSGILYSSLGSVSSNMEEYARIMLADAYFKVQNYQKSQEMLQTLDIDSMKADRIKDYVGILCNLQAQSKIDVSYILTDFWMRLNLSDGTDEKTAARLGALVAAGAQVFPPSYRKAETAQGFDHAYTLFLPLTRKFEMGTAAQILEETSIEKMEAALETVKDWNSFPIHALSYALSHGIRFPLPNKPLQVEEMDSLINRMAQEKESFIPIALKALEGNFAQTLQSLCWARGLALAALRVNDWTAGKIPAGCVMTLSMDAPVEPAKDFEAQSMAIARAFARVEGKYLPVCYTPELLNREALFLLPPLHRFGWYCAQAFQALDRGDQVGYVRLLREGLASCENAKDAVEFLLDHIPEAQPQEPSAELAAMAERLRTMLAGFAPDDPALAALKQSEAYQKVACLIEGLEAPVMGGLAQ